LFFSTYLRWYHLSEDAVLRDVLIEAGRTMALRRQKGGYLASFVGPESLFIDIMMNIGIVFWAANATGDEVLWHIAREHCETTAKYLVRPDGGTAHEGIFGVDSGRFERESTHQGYKPESTWSRGLAWAIYGFTAAHRLTGPKRIRELERTLSIWEKAKGEKVTDIKAIIGQAETFPNTDFVHVACRCAEFYLRCSPPRLVPYWDFDAPVDIPPLWDSSAAAIAASGLWDLSEEVADAADADRYRNAALTILQSLCSDDFLAQTRRGWEGILLHGVYHKNKNLGVNESVAWGDHFFVEALVKAIAGRSDAAW